MTPQEEDDVRRLLADARHTGPTPDDVVARLDRALAELAADAPVATVTPLAQRRRNAGRLLVAAAAVVLVGVGVAQVLDGTAGSTDSEDATAGAERSTVQDSTEAEPPAEGGAGSASQAGPAGAGALVSDGIVRLRSDSFATEVTELSSAYLASTASGEETDAQSQGTLLPDGLTAAAVTCRADSWGRGRFVAVRYDRVPAVLVFRRAAGDTQVADLFLCGRTSPERSVTLPAP